MRKVEKNEIEFIEDSLLDLESNLKNIKTYLETNVWTNIEDESKRKREFKFQADLFDKYNLWLEKYMTLSGIVEFYNENNKDKEDKLRKGFKGNELMDMLQKGELNDEDE